MIEFDKELIVQGLKEYDSNIGEFIEQNAYLIDSNNFDELFAKWNNSAEYIDDASTLASVLLLSGIDFLDHITKIPDYCFYNLPITTVILPDNIIGIGIHAFEESSINSIVFPKSIRVIPSGCFANARELKMITLPNSLENIHTYAFSGCYSLSKVIVPSSLKYIDPDVFYGCNKLNSLIYLGTKEEWKSVVCHTSWDHESNITSIKCTDGIIKVDE